MVNMILAKHITYYMIDKQDNFKKSFDVKLGTRFEYNLFMSSPTHLETVSELDSKLDLELYEGVVRNLLHVM